MRKQKQELVNNIKTKRNSETRMKQQLKAKQNNATNWNSESMKQQVKTK